MAGPRPWGAAYDRVRHSEEQDEKPTAYFARAFLHPMKGYGTSRMGTLVIRKESTSKLSSTPFHTPFLLTTQL